MTGADVGITLAGRIVRARRLGFRRFELGVSVTGVDEEVARLLARIARDHRASVEVAAEDAA